MSGKGSAPRPFSVSNQEYAERWDAIFGKRMNEQKPQNVQTYVQTENDLAQQALEQMALDAQRKGLTYNDK